MYRTVKFLVLLFASASMNVESNANVQNGLTSQFASDEFEKENSVYLEISREGFENLKRELETVKYEYGEIKKFQNELGKGFSKIDEMKTSLQRTIDQQQEAMSQLTSRFEKFMKATNEGRECYRYDDNANACIHTPFCAFCFQDDFPYSRCDIPESLQLKGCPRSSLINSNASPEIVLGPKGEKASEVPVSHNVLLCPGMKRNIKVNIQTINIPVDVYLLTDLYGSSNIKTTPHVLKHLVTAVESISSDYTLGLGISVDKPKIPFGEQNDFSYKNVLPLTKQYEEFVSSIHSTQCSYSEGDSKDGILEGIFQAAACKRQIKWRNNSRKILLVAVGFPYHVQGDGPEGEIAEPFEDVCALNETGFYENELTHDYPSEEQIAEILENENITIVFAAHHNFPLYKSLTTQMNSPAFAFEAKEDFTNLTDIFIEAMNEMNLALDLQQSKTSDDVGVTIYSKCNSEMEETSGKCNNVMSGTSAFKVEFQMLNCPSADQDRNQLLTLSANSLPISAEIQLHLFCNCSFNLA